MLVFENDRKHPELDIVWETKQKTKQNKNKNKQTKKKKTMALNFILPSATKLF